MPWSMGNELSRFAALVRAGRRDKGWSQEELAAKAEISPESVSNIERAKFAPTFEVVVKMIDALGLEPNVVFKVDQRSKKPTAQRLADEATIALLVAGFDDRQIGLLRDVAAAIRARAPVEAKKGRG